MKKNFPPITEETFSKFSGFIEDVFSRNESCTIIGLNQREQLYRINQFLNQTDKFKHSNTKIIDLNSQLLEDSEDFQLKEINQNERTLYLIIGADKLLEEKSSLLTYFNTLTKEYDKLTLIFFFKRNITYPWNLAKISPYQYLLQNIFFYPPYQESDQKQFLLYLEKKFKYKLTTKIKKLIRKNCAGQLWLIKEAVRYLVKTKNPNGIFNHPEMTFRLQVIYDELEEKEKTTVKKIVKDDKAFNKDEHFILNYFKKIGFPVPLLNEFVRKKINEENVLALNKDKKITLNSVVIDSFLSKKERAALRLFFNRTSKVIPRETVASTIWGENNSYSDWALDQFIKRLREKFKKLGISQNLIKTIKNQGYIFSDN